MKNSTRKFLVDHLSMKAGRDVATPAGSEWLTNDIISVTHEHIGVNTVKRLTGVLPSDDNTIHARQSTLDIISRYLGYPDWNAFYENFFPQDSAFSVLPHLVELDKLPVGTRVRIGWDPGRKILIRHIGGSEYEVENSEKSKLSAGDHLMMSQIMVGWPLIIKEVIRAGESLGSYTAAADYGLNSVKVLE